MRNTLAVATVLLMCLNGARAADGAFVIIGTGGVTGVYYPTGGAICQLVNAARAAHGIRCSVESTGGSLYNLNALRAGEVDIGLAQSDLHFHAFHGTDTFSDRAPFSDLRSLFSVHAETFTVLARADAGIKTLADLKGKRVNIGNPGSGQRATMQVLMAALGWRESDFASATELKSAAQAKALCENTVDAIVFIVGHPSGSIKEATTSCDAVLIGVAGDVVDELATTHKYYSPAIIPGRTYRGNERDVATFGVGATVVSSTHVSEEVAYHVVKSVFEHFDTFRSLHPALARLEKSKMLNAWLAAPLHAGALRYFNESGLR